MTQDNAQIALQATIDAAWEDRASLSPKSAPKDVLEAVEQLRTDTPPSENGGQIGEQPRRRNGRGYVTLDDGTRIESNREQFFKMLVAEGGAGEFIVGENHGKAFGKMLTA